MIVGVWPLSPTSLVIGRINSCGRRSKVPIFPSSCWPGTSFEFLEVAQCLAPWLPGTVHSTCAVSFRIIWSVSLIPHLALAGEELCDERVRAIRLG